MLPVSYEGRVPSQAPSLAIVFVLDRSSSMTGSKIQFLKEAAAAGVEVLDEQDRLSLLAFDTAWVFSLGPAEDRRKIAALQAGGGTVLERLEPGAYLLSVTAERPASIGTSDRSRSSWPSSRS